MLSSRAELFSIYFFPVFDGEKVFVRNPINLKCFSSFEAVSLIEVESAL